MIGFGCVPNPAGFSRCCASGCSLWPFTRYFVASWKLTKCHSVVKQFTGLLTWFSRFHWMEFGVVQRQPKTGTLSGFKSSCSGGGNGSRRAALQRRRGSGEPICEQPARVVQATGNNSGNFFRDLPFRAAGFGGAEILSSISSTQDGVVRPQDASCETSNPHLGIRRRG